MTTACKCGTVVQDGVNGTVDPPPPWAAWDEPPQATCYGCENKGELEGDTQRQQQTIDAALRAGRVDLV
jgi:hypothetical protein